MRQLQETREQGFSQRIAAALADLAALSLRTSTLRFSSPDELQQFAHACISQLVTLCEAHQGALFLAQSHTGSPVAPSQHAASDSLPVSLLASVDMGAEEAQAALATHLSTVAQPEWSLSLGASSPTLVWKQICHVPPTLSSFQEEATSHGRPYMLLLFVWPEHDQECHEGQPDRRDQAMHLLPFLSDMVKMLLLHLCVALQETAQSEEMLPAELLATVGHEFRGPLTTIQGYAGTLLRHEHQLSLAERQDFLIAINDASTSLGKLVDRFLEMAQFETQAHPFMPVAVDIKALAYEAITAVQKARPHVSLLVPPHPQSQPGEKETKGVLPGEELSISGDRRLLRMLLDLLLENALVYSSPESPVELSLVLSDPAQLRAEMHRASISDKHMALILPATFPEDVPVVEIRVQDHGIGIASVHLSHIFQRFYRVDTSLTREVNGLGLGLALCKEIVARHRGLLWVESVVGEGSTFHIGLPRLEMALLQETVEQERNGRKKEKEGRPIDDGSQNSRYHSR
ncbi:MAG TPA: HAMP domain-containing sensor histidine kinase [Ktedonobacteraceae bacterium]|nr:HAMP domain-containing sensor histidine kinase [Ktedonobacteraceae bacterium]